MKSKTGKKKGMPLLFLAILFMLVITVVISLDNFLKNSHDVRSRAYQQTAKGLSIEGEEMNISGNVRVDPSGNMIIFGE